MAIFSLSNVERTILLALKPLIEVTDAIHTKAKTDASYAEWSTKLVESACLIAQSTYLANKFRVSITFSLDHNIYIQKYFLNKWCMY